MDNTIDVNEIMKELEQKLKQGLSEKRLTITDISKLIGEYTDKAKEKVMKDAGNIITQESSDDLKDTCKDCGGRFKKTKKRGNR